jgi:hypothetical protein
MTPIELAIAALDATDTDALLTPFVSRMGWWKEGTQCCPALLIARTLGWTSADGDYDPSWAERFEFELGINPKDLAEEYDRCPSRPRGKARVVELLRQAQKEQSLLCP